MTKRASKKEIQTEIEVLSISKSVDLARRRKLNAARRIFKLASEVPTLDALAEIMMYAMDIIEIEEALNGGGSK